MKILILTKHVDWSGSFSLSNFALDFNVQPSLYFLSIVSHFPPFLAGFSLEIGEEKKNEYFILTLGKKKSRTIRNRFIYLLSSFYFRKILQHMLNCVQQI